MAVFICNHSLINFCIVYGNKRDHLQPLMMVPDDLSVFPVFACSSTFMYSEQLIKRLIILNVILGVVFAVLTSCVV